MTLALDPASQDLLFRSARTANTFTAEPVTEQQIEAVYDLVKYGPTAFNSQPLRILLLRSAGARARLAPYLGGANRAKSASAPLVAVLTADTGFPEHLPTVFPHRPGAKDWFADEAERDRQARFNATLQIGYFLLGVRAAGLAAGPMAGFDAAGVEREFLPGGTERALLVVNLGRPGPGAWAERLPRLAAAQVVRAV